MRGPRCEVRGTRSEVRGPRSEVRGPRSEVRGPRCEVRGARCEVVRSRRFHCQVRSQIFVCDKHMYWLHKLWLVVNICILEFLVGDKHMYFFIEF